MIGFDTETYLIRRDCKAPRLVCLSMYSCDEDPPDFGDGDQASAFAREEGGWGAVVDRETAIVVLPQLLAGTLCGHNTAYDLAVLCDAHAEATGTNDAVRLTLRALDEGRVFDTEIREKLIRIAFGQSEFMPGATGQIKTLLSLDACVSRYFGVNLAGKEGDDVWRLRFAELDGVPMDQWPEDALEYAAQDAKWPLYLADAQVQANPPLAGGYPIFSGDAVISEARETAAAFALHLMACWGLRTDPESVARCLAEWRAGSDAGRQLGAREGWVRVKGRDKGKSGSTNLAVLRTRVEDAYREIGLPAPRSGRSKTHPQGQVKYDEETLEDSRDPTLLKFAESMHFTNWLSKYADPLIAGTVGPLTYSVDVLKDTGRTAVSKPALQQPPREGEYRGCHVPRPGWVYADADYDSMELGTLAQVCLWTVGRSELATVINAQMDPHIVTAMAILEAQGHPERPLTYEEACERKDAKEPVITDARQKAKPVNFGLAGMMGVASFCKYAWSQYRVRFTETEGTLLKRVWLERYPEMPAYFNWIGRVLGSGNTIQQFVSDRVRSGVRAPAAANSFFQGLGADGAKYGAWVLCMGAYAGIAPADAPPNIVTACKDVEGLRPVLFLHDEILSEAPEAEADRMAKAQAEIMVWAMARHTPDVRAGAKPVLMRKWIKGAKPKYAMNGSGLLVPVEG